MNRGKDPRGGVESPCIDVCKMNPDTRLCEGCFRTLEEIAAWSQLSADEKRAVLEKLRSRRASR
jgi:predicted Fe-S protein YdhL (DUF1289 family)